MGQKEINDLCIGILEGVRESYLPPKEVPKCVPAESLLKQPPYNEKSQQSENRKNYDSDDNESDGSLVSHSSNFGGNVYVGELLYLISSHTFVTFRYLWI